jgi:bifunctional enzyme CysN/CysC
MAVMPLRTGDTMSLVENAAADDASLLSPPLQFLVCGSVDDGKSTLIGRLLFESGAISDDQLTAIERASATYGATGAKPDLALVTDGLQIEREQGITIDVAYRYFRARRRAFVVADTPGHEQYTRNMATGASRSELAVLVVDAGKGCTRQTRRHARICGLLGIPHVLVVVNKMDVVAFDEAVFEAIRGDFAQLAARLGFASVSCIPVCATEGDNVTKPSQRTLWYRGPTLIEALETADAGATQNARPFRLTIQRVVRSSSGVRGYAGTIVSGHVRCGDTVTAAVSGQSAPVRGILGMAGECEQAGTGDAETLFLGAQIDLARGDVLCHPTSRCMVADQFAAHVIWMSEEALLPGRSYDMRIGTRWLQGSVTAVKHVIDVDSGNHLAGRVLNANEIGLCNLVTSSPVAFDAYCDNRDTGSFVLIDRITKATAGAGVIMYPLRRAANIHPEHLIIDKSARAALKAQKPCVLWFTGLSGSGKSTIAKRLEKRLHFEGRHTYVLDGDNIRHGLNRDLGFAFIDRVENIRRIGEVARLFVDAGMIILCAFISPFLQEREMVRAMFEADEFVEIFVDAPLAVCQQRDPKGLYAKALRGELPNFTGIDSPYEPPTAPELHLATGSADPDESVNAILAYLAKSGRLG